MSVEPVVWLSAIEHYQYCPRQCALIHADGVWVENEHTLRGSYGHRRADSGEHRRERGRFVMRSIPLWSEGHGLAGRADAVEIDGGDVMPVEYKIGVRHGHAAELQLAGQALCLEEMLGRPVTHGAIWYSATRRRVQVAIDSALRELTLEVVADIRSIVRDGRLPPAPDDARCRECQLLGHCMPSVVRSRLDVEARVEAELWSCG